MPIYEYECTSCKVRFDRQQSVHDEPVRECPECGATTRRVFHPVGIIFKGSGFYVTDNRRPSPTSSSPSSDSSKENTSETAGSTAKGQSTESSATKAANTVGAKAGSD